MDLCTAPLPPFSRSSQSHLFLFYLTSHSLKVLLISLFAHLYTGSWLSSTLTQATSITKRVCFYITFSQVHSSTHHTHFRCPTPSTCRHKVTIPTYPHREASLFNFVPPETLRIPYVYISELRIPRILSYLSIGH